MRPATHCAVGHHPYVGSTFWLNWVWPVKKMLVRICSICRSHLQIRPHLAWSRGKRCSVLKVIWMEAILVPSSPYLCQCYISRLGNSVCLYFVFVAVLPEHHIVHNVAIDVLCPLVWRNPSSLQYCVWFWTFSAAEFGSVGNVSIPQQPPYNFQCGNCIQNACGHICFSFVGILTAPLYFQDGVQAGTGSSSQW